MEQQENFGVYIENMFCSRSHKTASLMCCSSSCSQRTALACRDHTCGCLPQFHKNCEFLLTEPLFERIQARRERMAKDVETMVYQIAGIYDEAIEKLSSERESLRNWKQFYGLSKGEIELIRLVKEGSFSRITGSAVSEVKQHLESQRKRKESREKTEKIIIRTDEIQRIWRRDMKVFDRIFHNFQKMYRMNWASIDSKIIEECSQLKTIFQQNPVPNKSVKSFRLLYRASSHNFSTERFHNICDGIRQTLTLVKTEFGKTVGGYTPLAWQSTEEDQWCCDQKCESFLFSLTLDEKYPLREDQKDFAICNHIDEGPRFGYGKDMRIGDQADQSNQSYFDFPTSYNEITEKYKHGDPKSIQSFCGSRSGIFASLEQWEVFEVVWHE